MKIKHDLPLNNRLLPDDLNETDESYTLNITSTQISLDAFQWSGVMRGLSTLSQLIKGKSEEEAGGVYQIKFVPMQIGDWPRFVYRGFMLDTARRYYPEDKIIKLLDTMAVAKFNIFHWHIVEDESFPLELSRFPAMWKNGAFVNGETYSKDAIRRIVEHATKLAIRMVPEFDNPGHSRAIGFDPYFTEIVRCFNKTDTYTLSGAYEIKGTPLSAPLDPSMEKTYEAI